MGGSIGGLVPNIEARAAQATYLGKPHPQTVMWTWFELGLLAPVVEWQDEVKAVIPEGKLPGGTGHWWRSIFVVESNRAYEELASEYQARLAADHILGEQVRARGDGAGAPRVVFTDPGVEDTHTATVDWGTALGVLRTAHEQGKKIHVLVDETRPRLQGARLTAWELDQYGIPYEIISDNMSGYFLKAGKAQKVLFGADRVAANGDVANKIGTYMLALAAHDNGVPAYSVAPTSTVDLSLEHGDLIPIEERDPAEVTARFAARNPAFDVTPASLVTAIVTELGVHTAPYEDSISSTCASSAPTAIASVELTISSHGDRFLIRR